MGNLLLGFYVNSLSALLRSWFRGRFPFNTVWADSFPLLRNLFVGRLLVGMHDLPDGDKRNAFLPAEVRSAGRGRSRSPRAYHAAILVFIMSERPGLCNSSLTPVFRTGMQHHPAKTKQDNLAIMEAK
jgi:hypothetical protein